MPKIDVHKIFLAFPIFEVKFAMCQCNIQEAQLYPCNSVNYSDKTFSRAYKLSLWNDLISAVLSAPLYTYLTFTDSRPRETAQQAWGGLLTIYCNSLFKPLFNTAPPRRRPAIQPGLLRLWY